MLSLIEFDAKTALGCDFCRLHSRGSAAYNQHNRTPVLKFGIRGNIDHRKLQFVTCCRRLNATEAQIEPHTPNPVWITGDSETDRLTAPFTGFRVEGGLTNVPAPDINQASNPCYEHAL